MDHAAHALPGRRASSLVSCLSGTGAQGVPALSLEAGPCRLVRLCTRDLLSWISSHMLRMGGALSCLSSTGALGVPALLLEASHVGLLVCARATPLLWISSLMLYMGGALSFRVAQVLTACLRCYSKPVMSACLFVYARCSAWAVCCRGSRRSCSCRGSRLLTCLHGRFAFVLLVAHALHGRRAVVDLVAHALHGRRAVSFEWHRCSGRACAVTSSRILDSIDRGCHSRRAKPSL